MRIASSTVGFASQHAATQRYTKRESLRSWVGTPGAPAARAAVPPPRPRVSAPPVTAEKAPDLKDPESWAASDPRMQVLIRIIERLTGQKVKIMSLDGIKTNGDAPAPTAPPPAPAAATSGDVGWGVDYQASESYHEAETTSFTSQGTIRTADGREINFSYQLGMSRSYSEESSVRVLAGDAAKKKDPLVINFGGTAAQLTDAKYAFDLDADGAADQISFVGPNSGFLALDANGDGAINDGTELFGARSGNGFQELATYDGDSNGWIDENDAAFDQLKVWSKDAQGGDHLAGLDEAGVGAIYLGSTSTPFDVKNDQNHLLGQVRASGVYLIEQGTAGSVQQVDLVV